MLGDRAQRVLGVELAPQDERRAERHAEREVREAPGVEHRRGDHRRARGRAAGSCRDSAAAGSSDSGWRRWAPFGAAGRAAREDHDAALAARRHRGRRRRRCAIRSSSRGSSDGSSASCQAMKRLRPLAGVVRRGPRTRRRRRSRSGFSRSATSVICGPANAVLRYSAWAPSFEQRDRRVDEAAVVAAHDRDARRPRRSRVRRRRVRQRVRAPVDLGERERPELVDDRGRVRVADRADGVAGRRRRAEARAARGRPCRIRSGRVGVTMPAPASVRAVKSFCRIRSEAVTSAET